MKGSADSSCLGNGCSGQRVLLRSERDDLSRLASLVRRFFNVPVGYAAMLGHRDRVMSRIGVGGAYASEFRNLIPLDAGLGSPQMRHDGDGLPLAEDLGELKFGASAPIDTLCGQHLGLLVIADKVPRPEFSLRDLETLTELASLMADTVEIRMIASQAKESQLKYHEAEQRFRWMANGAETLIAFNAVDGSWEFVNDAWLKFTGRPRKEEMGDGWQELVHPAHRRRAITLYLEALQTRQPFTMEVPLRRRDGVYRWMRGNVTPRYLRDRTFAGFTVCLTDTSDYDEVQAEVTCDVSKEKADAMGNSQPFLILP